MKLLTALNLPTALDGLSQSEKVAYFQDAYESVINKIKLNVGLFPFMMDKACTIDKLNAKSTIVTSGSEIAFKEIVSFTKCNMQQDPDSTDYTVTDSVVGNPAETDFGYDATVLEEINEEHTTAPSIYANGSDIVCTNMDTAFLNLLAYQYPYPVQITSLSPEDYIHYYPLDDNLGTTNVLDVKAGLDLACETNTSNISDENGSVDRCMDFDGTYGASRQSSMSLLPPFSVTAHVYLSEIPVTQEVVFATRGAQTPPIIQQPAIAFVDNGYIAMTTGSNERRAVASSLRLNEWNSIVVSYDGVNYSCYINNVETAYDGVTSITSQMGSYVTSISGKINYYDDTLWYKFSGKIDEVKVFDKILTESEREELGIDYIDPVKYTSYNTEYRYDIQWMIDTYGINNLKMDDFLVYLVSLKACSLYYMDQGDPGLSETYRDYLTQLINLYNNNINPLQHGTPTILGGLGLSSGAQ